MVRPKSFLSCLPTSMRINIREQLAFLVLLAVVASLAVVAIPTWIFVYDFVRDVESDRLALTASLKAVRISSELDAMYMNIQSLGSRILVQNSLEFFYQNNTNWAPANESLQAALSAPGLGNLLQCRVYTRNDTGNPQGVLNVTGDSITKIALPDDNSNETVYVSDTPAGYPASLYPTLTYRETDQPDPANPQVNLTDVYAFDSFRMNGERGLLLGPLTINGTFALMSLTIPIYQSSSPNRFVLGYLTVVAKATSIFTATTSREGLGKTGLVLVIGPSNPTNRFNMTNSATTDQFKVSKSRIGGYRVHFLLPPAPLAGQTDRHSLRSSAASTIEDTQYFNVSQYPALMESYAEQFNSVNNASAFLSTTNEQGYKVAVGFARTNTSLANWTVLVEQAREEAFAPMVKLRNILLGTVFGTVGVIMIIVIPFAHVSVLPIRRLKAATEKTIAPPGYTETVYGPDGMDDKEDPEGGTGTPINKGLVGGVMEKFGLRNPINRRHDKSGDSRHTFMIPAKVPDRRHFIKDELTELTKTFNDMSEELTKQYQLLDEKVLERTRELEISKKAAEAANESKTLFIANISHELKTPLNGILGMASICMSTNNIEYIKESLGVLYKSGELLLHLLEDLLSFSKNQIGQQLVLKEMEFPLSDISSQISAIFEKQARERRIKLDVKFLSYQASDGLLVSPEGMGPPGTCMLKDMWLWGDPHRIQQVIINLVNNSIKFSNAGDTVSVRIKCIGPTETPDSSIHGTPGEDSRTSSISRYSKGNNAVPNVRNRLGPASIRSQTSQHVKPGDTIVPKPTAPKMILTEGTALSLNPIDPKGAVSYSIIRETTPAQAPSNTRPYMFHFEIEDTGPGISTHMQHRVFEPFVQGDLGLSRKFGGTGLGLSICQQLANLMGGRITLQSEVGVGSTFTMQIPVGYIGSSPTHQTVSRPQSLHETLDVDVIRSATMNNDAPHSPTQDPQPRLVGLRRPYFAPPAPECTTDNGLSTGQVPPGIPPGSEMDNLRVLVADDNNTNVEVVSRMLKIERINDVTVARDGQQAFEKVKAVMDAGETFDLVFMDVQMPNVDGLQSTRLIRQMGFTAPIVALTAFSEESNIKDCLESGMNEFLSKPIRRRALKQILKKFSTIHEVEESDHTTTTLAGQQTQDNTPIPTPTPGDADVPDPLANGVPTPPPERASEKSVTLETDKSTDYLVPSIPNAGPAT
ncbi:Histidine kinase osmosensor [Ceratocystis pirilliformis]|uniref:histidine kinase n=1 Tax=Ceratocystis pirilliformis TaxID=259994 RepID=A0ABR3YTX2_9PEZI